MNTKEAIERIKALNDILYKQEIDLIVEILQRGYKFEAVIEKVTREYYGAFVTFGTGTTMEIGEFLGGIEQEVMMEGDK